MGYESKLIIAERNEIVPGEIYTFDRVAEFYCACMGDYAFSNTDSKLFTKPIDFGIHPELEDEDIDPDDPKEWQEHLLKMKQDEYGDICHYAPIKDVLDYLKKTALEQDYYRRIPPLIALLETLVKEQEDGHWDNLIVVHYGY